MLAGYRERLRAYQQENFINREIISSEIAPDAATENTGEIRPTQTATSDDLLAKFAVRTFPQLQHRIAAQSATKFLIEGIVPERSLVLGVGDSGIGKSPLMYQMGLCVASGMPFLGRIVRHTRALYMDCENGIEQVSSIVSQLAKHLGLTQVPEDFLLWNLNDCAEDFSQGASHLEKIIRAARAEVVILDPLNAIFNGIEQDNPAANKALHDIRTIMRDCGCTFICLHHPRKYDPKQGINQDDSLEFGNLHRWFDRARGPRVLINGSDVRLGIEPAGLSLADPQLIVRGFRRVHGEIPVMRVQRALDEDGEPVGYIAMNAVDLLPREQREAFAKLPDEFAFSDAMQAYGKQNQATTDFLKKCIGAGLLRKVGRGLYEKITQQDKSALRGNPDFPRAA